MSIERPEQLHDTFSRGPIDVPPLESLVGVYARWHLNESSGIAVPDSSGNGRDGACQNMEDGDWVPGKLHNCLSFGGVNEFVDCGAIASWERNVPFSVECWFKTPPATSCAFVAKYDGGIGRGWLLGEEPDGRLAIHIRNGAGNKIYLKSPVGVDYGDSAWHHAFLTYDGSSAAAGVHLYVDGIDLALAIIANNLTLTMITGVNCRIGAYSTAGYIVGEIDEVSLHDVERSEAYALYRWNGGNGRERMPGGTPQ